MCGYVDPAAFKNRPMTNAMTRYVNKDRLSDVAVFNSEANEFTDGKGVNWVKKEFVNEKGEINIPKKETKPTVAKPPTIVKEPSFEGEPVPPTKPVPPVTIKVPLPQM